ncbi:MAG: 3-phosphoshikimate 1-carboxyvinyltransferase [Pseudomonadota bacterium]
MGNRLSEALHVAPGGCIQGEIIVPGDKSISHRAVMFGALAAGETMIRDCLLGADVLATIEAFKALGATIEVDGTEVRIKGLGARGLCEPQQSIDLGNSGTSMRLLTGILAGSGTRARLIGDSSLSRRPMRRVVDPLVKMGARIETSSHGTPPIVIAPSTGLTGIEYPMPIASAQVKSALLLAGLSAAGTTTVIEPQPTRDHTERMLEDFGVQVVRDGARISIAGGQTLTAVSIRVPADISSAAFFMVGAAIAEGGDVTLRGVGMNPTRTGVLEVLRLMGAQIDINNEQLVGHEPIADVRIRESRLRAIEVPRELVPLAIDEFPVLFVAAACARGTTIVRGAGELRHKESDRIAVMAEGLTTLGIESETFEDGIAISGGSIGGGEIDAHDDHRIAMAFAMAALAANKTITITAAENISTSFPSFVSLARGSGLKVQ